MNLVPIDYQHMAFPVWKAMWLDYVGPHASAMPPEVHQHTFDRAKAAGAPALHWRTNPANNNAIALYDKLATQTGVLSFRMQL